MTRLIEDSPHRVFSMMIARNGNLLYEMVAGGLSRDASHYQMSVTKSWTSAVVGVAIDQGIINSIDQPIGWKGQRISIFPDTGLVVALTGVIENDESGFYDQLISEHVLYAMRGQSLNENATSLGERQVALGRMREKNLGLESVEFKMRPKEKNKGRRLPWRD